MSPSIRTETIGRVQVIAEHAPDGVRVRIAMGRRLMAEVVTPFEPPDEPRARWIDEADARIAAAACRLAARRYAQRDILVMAMAEAGVVLLRSCADR